MIEGRVGTGHGRIIGYTSGVFDLFHVGHLRLLERARSHCDSLTVGVTTDEAALREKKRKPIIPFDQRCEIVEALPCVERVVPQHDYNKIRQHEEIGYDIAFVGSDWKGHPRWVGLERHLASKAASVMYLPYSTTVSTSELIKKIIKEYS